MFICVHSSPLGKGGVLHPADLQTTQLVAEVVGRLTARSFLMLRVVSVARGNLPIIHQAAYFQSLGLQELNNTQLSTLCTDTWQRTRLTLVHATPPRPCEHLQGWLQGPCAAAPPGYCRLRLGTQLCSADTAPSPGVSGVREAPDRQQGLRCAGSRRHSAVYAKASQQSMLRRRACLAPNA